MTSLHVTIKTEVDGSDAYIDAIRTHEGPDGVDTYKWVWGIEHNGFTKIDSGEVQHRGVDGSFKLLALILEKVRGRKADK
jgi:hypothetical protein